MKSFQSFAALVAVAVMPFAGHADTKKNTKKASKGEEIYQVDTSASTAKWSAAHITGAPHVGSVKIKDGHFELIQGKVVNGQVNVDLTTLTDEDLKDAEYNKKLVTHLKSPDFFDVEKYPTATFEIKSVSEVHNIVAGQPNADVSGTLTMHGVTHPVSSKMFMKKTDKGIEADGSLNLDRTDYGLKYNSAKYFDPKKLGDKLIKDDFTVTFHIIAKK